MNSQDIQNLQESYLAVYDDETRENLEFENWVNNLLDEGYDLSSYNLDELYETYIGEERAEGVRPYKAGPTQAEVRADAKKAAKKKAEAGKDTPGYGPEDKFKSDWKLRAVPSSTSKRKTGETETVSQRMDREAPYKTRPFSPLFTKQGSRTASAVTRATEGPGEPQSVTMPRKKSKPSTKIVRKNLNNSYDLYDIILSHLIDEGYADTFESAEAIMVNMSEDWRESICEAILEYQPFKDKRKRVKSKVKKLESQKSEDPKDLGFRNARLQKRIDSMKTVLGKKNKEITSASQQKSYDSMAKGGFKHHDDPQSKYYIK